MIDAILQFEKSIEELESNAEIANHGVFEAAEEMYFKHSRTHS